MNKIIEVKNLTKKFGNFTALNQVNLEVCEGEVFGFIGPNGAGKSTTIRIILGVLQATNGSSQVFGLDSWEQATKIHQRIAYVPGDVNLWPNMTGGEVIDFFGQMRGAIDQELRTQLIKEFELDPTKKCKTYSKGNRQKVALISAFASNADLYILDEPTSGLDPLMANVFFKWVNYFKQQKKTVLLSSHILQEVEGLCDRVAIIRKGEIIEMTSIEELQKRSVIHVKITSEQDLSALDQNDLVTNEIITNLVVTPLANDQYQATFDVKSIDSIVDLISTLRPTGLEVSPPSLDDLFIKYYHE